MYNESEKPKGNAPAYKGDGIAVWENHTKEGKPYLTVQLFGKNGIRVPAWKYEPKEKEGGNPLDITEELIG